MRTVALAISADLLLFLWFVLRAMRQQREHPETKELLANRLYNFALMPIADATEPLSMVATAFIILAVSPVLSPLGLLQIWIRTWMRRNPSVPCSPILN